jgi:hypothetical protein
VLAMLGSILVEDYSLPFSLPFLMVLVEVKTQNSPFFCFVKIIKPIPDSRGGIKTLSKIRQRPRQSHFFISTK